MYIHSNKCLISRIRMASRSMNPEQILDMLERCNQEIETDVDDDTDVEEEDHDPTENIVVVNRLDVQDEEPIVVNIGDNDPITITEGCGQQDNQSQKKETNRKWRKKEEKSVVTDFTPKLMKQHAFNNAIDSFNLYFDDEVIDLIHYQTNLKSVQKGKPAKVTKDEIKVFLGINVIMGYSVYNQMGFYWKNGKDIGNQSIRESMSRNRFFKILGCLHLNDNSKLQNNKHDKLFKLRPFIDKLNANFFENKTPEEHLSIDESMIKFKGRSSLKQYNPMKPIKRGYKLWCLSDDSGYIYNFSIYCGKDEKADNKTRSELGLGGEVVLSLTKDLAGQNHKLFFDNYFSSIPLLEKLQQQKFPSCATIRPSRKDFPALANDKSLKRGDYDFRSTARGITAYKWMDTKPVHFISNYHGTEPTTVQRKQKNGQKLTVKCPRVASDYNKHMGGVDKHDMLRQIYGIDRKSVKWWHRLFFGLLDMAVVNAFIIYRESTGSSLSLLDFRREVGLGLLTNVTVEMPFAAKRRKVSYSVADSVRLGNVGVHFPLFNQTKARCEVCSKQNIESRPTSKCSFCGINLCCNTNKNCFTTYHTQK